MAPPDAIRLLLVDDEVGYLDVLRKRLTLRGLKVQTAPSGTLAMQAIKKADFDVAVVDLKMGDMDGIELLAFFKKMDPALEVIMLTGHGSEQAAREGLALGAFDYLTKPCDLNTLLVRIKAAAAKAMSAKSEERSDENA